jgi:WD40 repeat protein
MSGGSRELVYQGHTGDVRCLALSLLEDRLVSGSDDGTVRIWKVASAEPDVVLSGHLGSVRSVGFLSHDRELASASHDGTIRIWDVLSGNCVRTFHDYEGGMEDLAIWAGSSRALVASRDGMVRLWDLVQGDQQAVFAAHTAWVESVRWADEQRFVSCSLDGTVAVWDIAEKRCLARYQVGHRVSAVESIEGVDLVAFGGGDSNVTLASVVGGEVHAVERLTGHSDRVTALSVAAQANLLVSGSEDGTARIWSLDDGARPSASMRSEGAVRVTAVCLSDGGSIAVSAAEDGLLRAWSISTGQLAWQEPVLPGNIRPTCLATDGSRIVVGTDRGSLVILDARTGTRLHTLVLHEQPVSRVRMTTNGILLAAGDDGRVSLWDTNQGTLLNASGKRRREARALAVCEAAGIGISGAFDGSVWVHPMDQQELAYKLGDHGEQVISVAVSPDGQVVWSASRDGTVRMWPLAGSRPPLTDSVPEDLVNCLAMSTDGRWAAAGCRDGTVKIWEGQRHARLLHSWRLRGPISELYFSSPDGLLIAVSRAGTCQALALNPFGVVASVELGQTVAAAAGSTSGDLIMGGVSGDVFLLALQGSR